MIMTTMIHHHLHKYIYIYIIYNIQPYIHILGHFFRRKLTSSQSEPGCFVKAERVINLRQASDPSPGIRCWAAGILADR